MRGLGLRSILGEPGWEEKLRRALVRGRGVRMGEATVISRRLHVVEHHRPSAVTIMSDVDFGQAAYGRRRSGDVIHIDIFHAVAEVAHQRVAAALRQVLEGLTGPADEGGGGRLADYFDLGTATGGGRITSSMDQMRNASAKVAHRNHVHIAGLLPDGELSLTWRIVAAVEEAILAQGVELRRIERLHHRRGGAAPSDDSDLSRYYGDNLDSHIRGDGVGGSRGAAGTGGRSGQGMAGQGMAGHGMAAAGQGRPGESAQGQSLRGGRYGAAAAGESGGRGGQPGGAGQTGGGTWGGSGGDDGLGAAQGYSGPLAAARNQAVAGAGSLDGGRRRAGATGGGSPGAGDGLADGDGAQTGGSHRHSGHPSGMGDNRAAQSAGAGYGAGRQGVGHGAGAGGRGEGLTEGGRTGLGRSVPGASGWDSRGSGTQGASGLGAQGLGAQGSGAQGSGGQGLGSRGSRTQSSGTQGSGALGPTSLGASPQGYAGLERGASGPGALGSRARSPGMSGKGGANSLDRSPDGLGSGAGPSGAGLDAPGRQFWGPGPGDDLFDQALWGAGEGRGADPGGERGGSAGEEASSHEAQLQAALQLSRQLGSPDEAKRILEELGREQGWAALYQGGGNQAPYIMRQLEEVGLIRKEVRGMRLTPEGRAMLAFLRLHLRDVRLRFRKLIRRVPGRGGLSPAQRRRPGRGPGSPDVRYGLVRGTAPAEPGSWLTDVAVPESLWAALRRTHLERLRRGGGAARLFLERKDLRVYLRAAEQSLHICLLIDASASMAGRRIMAAKHLARHLLVSTRDRVAVIAFQEREVRVHVPFTRDYSLVEEGLSRIQPMGLTPLAHGLTQSMDLIRHSRVRRPLLLLITDGIPTVPKWSVDPLADALEAARQVKLGRIPFGCIGLQPSRRYLDQLTREAGGTLHVVDELSEESLVLIAHKERIKLAPKAR